MGTISNIHGVAATFRNHDEHLEGLVNELLVRRYPGVVFEDEGSSDFNLRVEGQGRPDVTAQIDYESVWAMTRGEVEQELGL